MRTHVDPDALGASARALSTVAADLAEARRRLSAVHASAGADLGRAGAAAAHDTWRAGDRALSGLSDGVSNLADGLRLLAYVYADVDRTALR